MMKRAVDFLKSLMRQERGNVVIVVAVMMFIFIVGFGSASDLANQAEMQNQLQIALQGAGVAAEHALHNVPEGVSPQEWAQKQAQNYFDASFFSKYLAKVSVKVVVAITKAGIQLSASMQEATKFLSVIGIDSLQVASTLTEAVTFETWDPKVAAPSPPETVSIDGINVAVWLPPAPTPGKPWPIIIFSHGFLGCNTQSSFLMVALAKEGYAVFAPNHADATCDGGHAAWSLEPAISFLEFNKWSDTTFANRKDDIEKLLALLPLDSHYNTAAFDWKHVGLAGHSLGGYTVLGMGGAWPSWKEPKVSAVLALSPYSVPFVYDHLIKNVSVPVMYQGGTQDTFLTPFITEKDGAYDQTVTAKWFVDFAGAQHLSWTDLTTTYQSSISAYSVAFFNHTLKGEAFPESLTAKSKLVSEVLIKE